MTNVSPILRKLAHREMLRGVDLNNSGNPNLASIAWHRQNKFEMAANDDREAFLKTLPESLARYMEESKPYVHADVLPSRISNRIDWTSKAALLMAAMVLLVLIAQ